MMQRVEEHTKRQTRQLTKYLFYKHVPNRKKVVSENGWFISIQKTLFCFCCKLFTAHDKEGAGVSKCNRSLQNWWKPNPKVSQHENSDAVGTTLKLNKSTDAPHEQNQEMGKSGMIFCIGH